MNTIRIKNPLPRLRRMRRPVAIVHADDDTADFKPLLDVLSKQVGREIGIIQNGLGERGTLLLVDLSNDRGEIIDPY